MILNKDWKNFFFIIILWWSLRGVVGNDNLVVKSCVYVRNIKHLQYSGENKIYITLWRDNDKSTSQNTTMVNYNSTNIDLSGASPICWSFSTDSITRVAWKPLYAVQVTMAINGKEKQGALTIKFPYNSTSVFNAYVDKSLDRVDGSITFDIYHIFSGNYIKISNRNFMVYTTCYKLWAVCVEQGSQGNHLQCINNAVIATKPTGGQTALNDISRGTTWGGQNSNAQIPNQCWQPYDQYVTMNVSSKWFGLIRIGMAQYNGFSSRSWQSSDRKPGKYFTISFGNSSGDGIKDWQYWYADLSDSNYFSSDITSPANSSFPFFIINPLFLRRDVDPYPIGKNRLTDIDRGFNQYWMVDTSLSYNSFTTSFTTWTSVLAFESSSTDNSTLRAIGTRVCSAVTGQSLKTQLPTTFSKSCYDTGVSNASNTQCTPPVYYPPVGLLYTGSEKVTCPTTNLRNCTHLKWCAMSELGIPAWCDNSAAAADNYFPFYIECDGTSPQTYTLRPSAMPTPSPTTRAPTMRPTRVPTTKKPTTLKPTQAPIIGTRAPTLPTEIPTNAPTVNPVLPPTPYPSSAPVLNPTTPPTPIPEVQPSTSPTRAPTSAPSVDDNANENGANAVIETLTKNIWIPIVIGAVFLFCALCLVVYCMRICYHEKANDKFAKFEVENIDPQKKPQDKDGPKNTETNNQDTDAPQTTNINKTVDNKKINDAKKVTDIKQVADITNIEVTDKKVSDTKQMASLNPVTNIKQMITKKIKSSEQVTKLESELSYPSQDIEASNSDMFRTDTNQDIIEERQTTQLEGVIEGDPAVTSTGNVLTKIGPQSTAPNKKSNNQSPIVQSNSFDDDAVVLEMQSVLTPRGDDNIPVPKIEFKPITTDAKQEPKESKKEPAKNNSNHQQYQPQHTNQKSQASKGQVKKGHHKTSSQSDDFKDRHEDGQDNEPEESDGPSAENVGFGHTLMGFANATSGNRH